MRSLALWTCLLCIAFWTTYSQQGSEAGQAKAVVPAEAGAFSAQQRSEPKEDSSLRWSDKNKDDIRIIYTRHARERMEQRGANDNEVRDTILTGEEVPNRDGMQKFEKTYDCDCNYKGRFYDDKKVEVVAKKKKDGWLIITVIADRK